MKRPHFWLLLLSSFLIVSNASAQMFFPQFEKVINRYYPGIIFYNDGHKEEYRWVELPKGTDKNIIICNDEKKKEKVKIPAVDIHHVVLWSEKQPEVYRYLYHIRTKSSNDMWGMRRAHSSWGMVVSIYEYYVLDKKSGAMWGMNNHSFPTTSYLLRESDEFAQPLMVGNSFSNVKTICNFFSEKPEIAKAIRDKKLKGDDIQYILDEMAGGVEQENKTEEKVEHSVEPHIEASENGVIGDDE